MRTCHMPNSQSLQELVITIVGSFYKITNDPKGKFDFTDDDSVCDPLRNHV